MMIFLCRRVTHYHVPWIKVLKLATLKLKTLKFTVIVEVPIFPVDLTIVRYESRPWQLSSLSLAAWLRFLGKYEGFKLHTNSIKYPTNCCKYTIRSSLIHDNFGSRCVIMYLLADIRWDTKNLKFTVVNLKYEVMKYILEI